MDQSRQTMVTARVICIVSKRHRLQQHLSQLAEISEIMNSMKNLAFMETRKLARYLGRQRQVTRIIEDAAEEFLRFSPVPTFPVETAVDVYLLIGSERGFCGDFNEVLLNHADTCIAASEQEIYRLIAVGRKLGSKLQNDKRLAVFLDGPSVTDEITAVLHQVALAVDNISRQYGVINLSVFYFDSGSGHASVRKVLPPFQELTGRGTSPSMPPLLNLKPQVFLAELISHYLFAALHEIFCASLMVENQKRIQHMDAAIRHVDDKIDAISRESHQIRQEEITEEIEVIMLTNVHQWPFQK